MTQTAIPFLFMRGGTSRAPYMRASDLPEDRETLAQVLISAVGAGHPMNIDGIGGGTAVTTKCAILSTADEDADADVNYFFAQVNPAEHLVDFKPTCGNVLAGVGPAAIEMGLVKAQEGETQVRIRAINTGALIESRVLTLNGRVQYDGETAIDGVPGTHAPVALNFMGVVGSATGTLLPTGKTREVIGGFEVTCIDVAMPMCIARAEDFGITGYESRDELDANKALLERIEAVRLEAGARMGMGDVSKSVTPKFGLLAPARDGGSFAARYFMPWNTHPAMAVTGAQCLSACALLPGTVAEGIAKTPSEVPAKIVIEHPTGTIDALIDYQHVEGGVDIRSAGLTRTARLLARGELYVPASVWAGHPA